MPQMASQGQTGGNMASKMPYPGPRPPGMPKPVTGEPRVPDQWKALPPLPNDSDPNVKAALKSMFEAQHLQPGMGLGTPTYSPDAGFQRERARRMAKGATAQERMQMFQDMGVRDTEGMRQAFNRNAATPNRAFMMARGR